MGSTDTDRDSMERALELARRGRGHVEPNPMVGALVVRGGRVVGEGWHERFGGPHAEVAALRSAGEAARGATLYVTLEPCAHQGKTPPCAPLVAGSGVARVVVAVLDPTPKTHGRGVRLLEEAGVRVEVGLGRREAVLLNAGFFKLAATGRPLVVAKWAMSADGKIATRTGDSRWISSPQARKAVHDVRGRVDCIIVGGRTALADDPLLTCREAERRRTAARLVLCGRRIPPADSRLVRSAAEAPLILAHAAASVRPAVEALANSGCELLPVEGGEGPYPRVDLGRLLDELGRRQMTNVLVEGGAGVLGAFLDQGLVDRVMVFVAPLLIGGAGATGAVAGRGVETVERAPRLRECTSRSVGPDILLEGWLADPLEWAP